MLNMNKVSEPETKFSGVVKDWTCYYVKIGQKGVLGGKNKIKRDSNLGENKQGELRVHISHIRDKFSENQLCIIHNIFL